MKNRTKTALPLLVLLLCACESEVDKPSYEDTNDGVVPESCDKPSSVLHSAQLLLEQGESHPCYDLVRKTYGRIGENGAVALSSPSDVLEIGSMTFWSKNTEAGTALAVSAAHVIDQERLPLDPTFTSPSLIPFSEDSDVFQYVKISSIDSEYAQDELHLQYMIFNMGFSEDDETYQRLGSIGPFLDFYVFALDSRIFSSANDYEEISASSPDFFDPSNISTSEENHAEVSENDMLILFGYPSMSLNLNESNLRHKNSFSLLRVLSESETKHHLKYLKQVGDEEGDIKYDPEVEIIAIGKGAIGQSGGGVFDTEGKLVGIFVRTSLEEGIALVRIVRISYIINQLKQALDSLTIEEREQILPYLDKTIF